MEQIKQENATRIEELESLIKLVLIELIHMWLLLWMLFLSLLFCISYRCHQTEKAVDEGTIKQLQQDLASQRNHIEFLTGRLDEVCSDVESKCECSIFLFEFESNLIYSLLWFCKFSAFLVSCRSLWNSGFEGLSSRWAGWENWVEQEATRFREGM